MKHSMRPPKVFYIGIQHTPYVVVVVVVTILAGIFFV